jgi:hypothetical protein
VQKLTDHLASTGKYLKLLSLADIQYGIALEPEEFEQICDACPNVQLGYWLPEKCYLIPLPTTISKP